MIRSSTKLTVVAVVFTALLASACSSADPASEPAAAEDSAAAAQGVDIPERYALQQALDFTIALTSTSVGGTFGRLDRKHSCERGDTSPHLTWEGVPDGAESLALVMEDLTSDMYGFFVDALWTHWVVYSIPPDVTSLETGQLAGEVLDNGSKQGANDFDLVQYNGPCPIPMLTFPPAQYRSDNEATTKTVHYNAEERPYYFKLYALDVAIDLPPGADRDTLLEAIDGHILAAGEVFTNYKSSKRFPCRNEDQQACLKKATLGTPRSQVLD